jgi:hypothetical protein
LGIRNNFTKNNETVTDILEGGGALSAATDLVLRLTLWGQPIRFPWNGAKHRENLMLSYISSWIPSKVVLSGLH